MFFLLPWTKPPTPGEYKVLVVALAVLLIVAGTIGVVAGLLAPASKHDVAVVAIRLGVRALLLGGFLLLALWFVRRLTD